MFKLCFKTVPFLNFMVTSSHQKVDLFLSFVWGFIVIVLQSRYRIDGVQILDVRGK